MATKKYDASSIQIIENLEAVRKRPGMYIGDTGLGGLHHLVWEIMDNSIDEALAGHATVITVILNKDNSIITEDNGRGIPVDIHPKTKKPAVETIFTKLHAGGKFGGDASGYKMSGGLHGVGASVVNALSKYLIVNVKKDGKEYRMSFKNGGILDEKLHEIGSTTGHGTKVEFLPDSSIFSTINYNSKTISDRLQTMAYLNPNVKIVFDDKKKGKHHEYLSKKGLVDFLHDQTTSLKHFTDIYEFSAKSDQVTVNVGFVFTNQTTEAGFSFVNNIVTPDGGSHEIAFKVALTKAINDYASRNNLLEKEPLEGDDIREGLTFVISAYLIESILQFEGQTKSKLSSKEARAFIEKASYEKIYTILTSNKAEASKIIKTAYSAKAAKAAAKRAREFSRELKKSKTKSFAGKLVTAQSKIAANRELFIVEGDSAGGSAKLGRDRKTQAILPLRGKVINTEKANLKAILANEELAIMINAIGGGLGEEFSKSKVNYGKIIIMTDADNDGAHIQALLLTFFYRLMTPLVDAGMVYIALPPLYKVQNKKSKKSAYAWNDDELEKIKTEVGSPEIQRYKGLGEMNFSQLWETTMNPDTRTLVKVDSEMASSANKIIEILMGQDPQVRREWIEENVEFSLEDNFKVKKSASKDETLVIE